MGAALDPDYLKPVPIYSSNNKLVKFELKPKHSETHVDCLLGGEIGRGYKAESINFRDNIRPADVISVSGLNTQKLLNQEWDKNFPPKLVPLNTMPYIISHGKFKNNTIIDVVKNYSDAKYICLLYGSNNRNFFNHTYPPEIAVDMLFTEIKMLLKESAFEAVFISCIFPGSRDCVNQKLTSNVKIFNELLLSEKSRREQKYVIKGKNNKIIKWVPIPIQNILPYENIHELKYFCSKNYFLPKSKQDLVHINAKYLTLFYCQLDLAIDNFKISHHKRQPRRKRDTDGV